MLMRCGIAALLLLGVGAPARAETIGAGAIGTEVVILATLHQYHEDTPSYGYANLAAIIERLEPDVLAVELTPADLATRRPQGTKREYQHAVFPLLDRHDWDVLALEPPEPLYGELVSLFRHAQQRLREAAPGRAEAFATYTASLYELLFERWQSAAAVNSAEYDLLFEAKHRFQSELFGPDEAEAWQRWNRHFADRIEAAAAAVPGRRIVVLVGVEHAYWLRRELPGDAIRVPDTATLLLGPDR